MIDISNTYHMGVHGHCCPAWASVILTDLFQKAPSCARQNLFMKILARSDEGFWWENPGDHNGVGLRVVAVYYVAYKYFSILITSTKPYWCKVLNITLTFLDAIK